MSNKNNKIKLGVGILCGLLLMLSYTCILAADGQEESREINIEDKGFSIISPIGWQHNTKNPGFTLMLRPPVSANEHYRRYIQVFTIGGPAYMDEMTAVSYAEFITKKFTEASSVIKDYKIRNYQPIKLDDGRKGYLYYAEFKIGNDDLMQMHVLISSASRHFVITFTDLAHFFDPDKAPRDHVTEAWESIMSIKLDTPTPVNWVMDPRFILIASMVLVGLYLVYLIRSKTNSKRYNKIAEKLESSSDDEIDYGSYEKSEWKIERKRAELTEDDEEDVYTDDNDNLDDEDEPKTYQDVG